MPRGGDTRSFAARVPLLQEDEYVEVQAQARETERRVLILERTLTRQEVMQAGVFALGLQAFIAAGRAYLEELHAKQSAYEGRGA